ncbi:MAG: J domain-containing protein [Acidimicrobiales bacterium]|nr:J domain-containing protein [Acidimicrobiales bacterium]
MLPNHSDILNALEELGATPEMSWGVIRAHYRQRIREVHPDLVNSRTATTETARLNNAFDILSQVTESGRKPLPIAKSNSLIPAAFEFSVPLIDAFHEFVAAAHHIGSITYSSRDDGLIRIRLEQGIGNVSELLIVLDTAVEPVTALFTLESSNKETAPELGSVVTHFEKALSAEAEKP